MDFAEDCWCWYQEKIQSAYWSQTLVTIHLVVTYYKQGDKLVHQSSVYVSDEPHHNARFVSALITKLMPTMLELLSCLKFVHYWTDSPTSQCRSKTIFKTVSCHPEYFNVLSSWSYIESSHWKGPCDPIGGTVTRKVDLAIKNGKAVIEDALNFLAWAKEIEETSTIRFCFLSFEDFANAALLMIEACKDIKPVQGMMKLHAMLPYAPNKIWVRDNSCFGDSV